MEIFIKSVSGILVAVILGQSLSKQGKDVALLLTMGVCAMVLLAAMRYFKPVVDFFQKLQTLGKLNGEMLSVLLKSVGIGILAEITGMFCSDSGNAALGKAIHVLASGVILCLSVPIMTELITLIEEILVSV